jgi:hypothetical protein
MKKVIAAYCFIALLTYAGSVLSAQESKQTTQDSESKASAPSSQHYEAQPSEHLQTEDHVQVKLTPGQRKAVESAKDLPPDNAAVFKADGTLVRKGLSKDLEDAFKDCKDLRPISDKCWLCKDNGTIICGREHHSKPDSPVQPLKRDPK